MLMGLTDLLRVLSDPRVTQNKNGGGFRPLFRIHKAAGEGLQRGLTQWTKNMRRKREKVKLCTYFLWKEGTE